MRSPSQHSIHRRLGRILPNDSTSPKPASLDARSPQFGSPFGGGSRGGGDRDWDRFGGGGGGNNTGPPARRPDPGPPAGRPNPGPSFGRPEPGPPFGGGDQRPPFGGNDSRPPFGRPNPEPPAAPGPKPKPAPAPAPAPAPQPAPANRQPQNGGANPAGGDGTNLNNGGNVNGDGATGNINQSTSTTPQAPSSSSPSTSAAARGSPVQLAASATSSTVSSSQAASPSLVTGGTPLETLPAAGPEGGAIDAPGLNPTGGVSRAGLSGGIIAAIVLLSLFFAVLILVLLLRRRWISRRSERFGTWWINRRQNSRTYGDNPNYGSEKQTPFEWNRDDFAVSTMDRSASPLDLSNIVPMAPPMAEVRRLRNGSDAHLVAPSPSERFSIGSGDSFVVHHPTAVSHRMSDTESFKFPKPPSHSEFATAASIHSRFGSSGSNSAAVSLAAACGHTPLNQSQPSLLGSRPVLAPPPPQSRQPSADGIPNPFADADGSESMHNPFASNSISSIGPLPLGVGDLTRTEIIRRPFLPTMNDELNVEVDDEVKILQIFDDGWALVEKVQVPPVQGLVPLACLRDMGQGLTSLLSTRRVQSMHVSEQITE